MMRGGALGCVVLALVACARPGAPPGGIEETDPPALVEVRPESGAVNVRPSEVRFAFDEVVNERPRLGGNTLDALVVLSPSDGAPRVSWEREAITVRPRRGWRPNTAYTVTILPGLADLGGAVRDSAVTTRFTTGGPFPSGVVRGAVFEWTTLRPSARARIEATVGSDTTWRWIARVDSTGRYELPLLPAGAYRLRGFIDENGDGLLDRRELWDSTTVQVSDSARVDLYAFVHDTLGPRIATVTVRDSLHLRVQFDRAIALGVAVDSSSFTLQRADSTKIAITRALASAEWDSVSARRRRAIEDSTRKADTTTATRLRRARDDSARLVAQRDSVAREQLAGATRGTRGPKAPVVPPPTPTRAAPQTDFVLELAEPLASAKAYRVRAVPLLGLTGYSRASDRVFTTPRAEKPAADSAKSAPPPARAAPARMSPVDSLRRVLADSAKKKPPR
ncbi:MAG: Ig-like domain-containing protein [Gemmatimonadaceae bacterium]|nr:Ig-like domain-containing protein [Gemmatimonadaceae bacterium]